MLTGPPGKGVDVSYEDRHLAKDMLWLKSSCCQYSRYWAPTGLCGARGAVIFSFAQKCKLLGSIKQHTGCERRPSSGKIKLSVTEEAGSNGKPCYRLAWTCFRILDTKTQ